MKIQTPRNLTPRDASSILLSYLENGFDFLPPGYADAVVLDSLLKKILRHYNKQFFFTNNNRDIAKILLYNIFNNK